MKVSLFGTEMQSVPEQRVVADFAELGTLIGPPRPYPSKKGIPMFSPAEWPVGERKTKDNVVAVHFGVLDFDDVPEDDLSELLARTGYLTDFLFITSWSHGDPQKLAEALARRAATQKADPFLAAWGAPSTPTLVRGRLVVPFSRPVAAAEWPRFWPHLAHALEHGQAKPDRACKDPNRCYWFPAHPALPPAPPQHLLHLEGRALDVDRLLALPPPAGAPHVASGSLATEIGTLRGPHPANHDITRHEIRELTKAWSRSAKKGKQEMVVALRAILDGEAFAEVGNHDNMLYRVCMTLTEKWPYASPESIAALLLPSLQVMSPSTSEGGENLQWALDKIRRGKEASREKIEIDQKSRIARYFLGERDTPYSEEEIRRFERQIDAKLGSRWVIQKAKSYYLFKGKPNGDGTCHEGDYAGPFTSDDVVNAARTLLAPAVSVGVALDVITEKGARAKTTQELVRDYGEVASRVVADLSAEFSYYDPDTQNFVEAPCPLRAIEPQFHPAIDRWLRLMAGEHYDRLAEWIAAATFTREPSSALYLEGPPGTGKTLLACGVARLWTKQGPVAFEECLGNFNEAILQCPLVFGDEVAPKDFRGRVRTGEIREFIQARQRPLKRKHLPSAIVQGCVRLILAANNKELLASGEHLTINDIAALVERFFYLQTQEAAAVYLKGLREDPATRRVIEAWVEQDQIAEHALYLRDTVTVHRNRRLLASNGEASELTRTLTTSTGIRSAVCNWLVSFLLDPSKLAQNPSRGLIRVHEGRLAVNARVFAEHWSLYPTNTQAPTAGRIAHAVAGLTVSDERVHKMDGTKPTWYRVIATENLVTWAEETGFASRETIESAIKRVDLGAGTFVSGTVN